jgi:hypothetical protein
MAVEKDYEFFPRQNYPQIFLARYRPQRKKKTGSDVRSGL